MYPDSNQRYYLRDAILPGDTIRLFKPGKYGWLDEIALNKNRKLNLFFYQIDSTREYFDTDSMNKNRFYQQISLTQHQLDAAHWLVKFSGK